MAGSFDPDERSVSVTWAHLQEAWMSESLHLLLRSDILSGNEFNLDLKGSPAVTSVQQHKQCMFSYHLLCTNIYISQQLIFFFFF